MERRKFLATGVSLTAGVAVAGCSGGTEESGSSYSDEPAETTTEKQYPNAWYYDEATGIVIQDAEGSVGNFSVTITGTAINDSGQDYSYVQLSFGLYDETDAKLGTALANINNLAAGQRWKFEAMGTDTNTASFRVDGITAY